ncbi:MAG: YncE family protein [Caldanaerobacter sp.]
MYLYVASMGEDFVERIDLMTFSRDYVKVKSYNNKHLPLNVYTKYLCGPRKLILDMDREKIYTLNCYDNSVSLIDRGKFLFEGSWYVGLYPVDGVLYKGCIFVVNADSNSVSIFDIGEKRVTGQFKVGSYPQRILYSKKHNVFFISNMNSGEILLIDPEHYTILDYVMLRSSPVDIAFSEDENYLYVANNCFDSGGNGKVSIIDLKDLRIVNEIDVGKVLIKISKEKDFLYILSGYSNTFCQVDLMSGRKKEVYCGEAPLDFVIFNNFAYVASSGDDRVYVFELMSMEKYKVIKTKKDPSGLLIDQ